MPDPSDILGEWRAAMQSIATTARDTAGRADLPSALVAPMQRQLELVQEVIERERNLQAQLAGHLLNPIDAVLNLLEESGRTFKAQADALEQASAALAQTATLMQTQADIYESTIRALREPADLALRVAGAKPRKPSTGGGKKSSGGKKS
jgi:hypothetical protein